MTISTSLSGPPTSAPTQADPSIPGPRVRFSLIGPDRAYDPARQAIRPDLADKAEADHHFAPHYAEPADWYTVRPTTLFADPSNQSTARRSLDAGAGFALLDLTGGWAWGYETADHTVGYVCAQDVAPTNGGT